MQGRVELVIEVVYAEPLRVVAARYRVARPATVEHVLRLAAADTVFTGIDIAGSTVGIFGRVVGPGEPLADGDRVEIYRPLAADPKTARRTRVRDARRVSKSGRS